MTTRTTRHGHGGPVGAGSGAVTVGARMDRHPAGPVNAVGTVRAVSSESSGPAAGSARARPVSAPIAHPPCGVGGTLGGRGAGSVRPRRLAGDLFKFYARSRLLTSAHPWSMTDSGSESLAELECWCPGPVTAQSESRRPSRPSGPGRRPSLRYHQKSCQARSP